MKEVKEKEQLENGDLIDNKKLLDDKGVEDRFQLVFLIFLLHGIGILLPWNLFINAREYFVDYKLNTNSSASADYRANFMNYVGLSAQLPNMLMSAFNVFFQSTKPSQQTGNNITKLMFVITLIMFVCLGTIVLAVLDTSDCPKLFFELTIVSVVILNCSTGIYQSSTFGMAANLPMSYSNAVVIGNNVCGTLIAVVNIMCKLVSAENQQAMAISYFSSALILLTCCFASLLVLPNLLFYRKHTVFSAEIEMKLENKTGLLKEEKGLLDDTQGLEVSVVTADSDSQNFISQNVEIAMECCAVCCIRENSMPACYRYWHRYWDAFKDCWVHCLSVWSIFFCTLSCFPTVQSSVQPVNLTGLTDWFDDIFVFLFFNAFAMIGNICSNFVQFPPPRTLFIAVWIRTVFFIPFFLFCNCFSSTRSLPVLVANDFAFIVGVIVFAFTSGYFSSLCMMYAPRCVKKAEHAGLAAMVAAFCLVFGIFCGISFGTFLSNIV